MKLRYDLIVFDWDGTLMDSEVKIERCLSKAAREVGVDAPPVGAIRHVPVLGFEEIVRSLFPHESAQQRMQLAHHFRLHFLHLDETGIDLFPGVEEGLEDLVSRGYVLAVATANGRQGLSGMLARTGLERHFRVTRCADEARAKPHPQMLEDILAEIGIARQRALMVGDTVADLRMARMAGVDGLAVSYGMHAREQLLAHQPVACVESFSEVCQWLR
ncbi:MAG: HAD-IA family hydrolase [Gammaproteobacteria bacterium]|nr:MAG: HAD-IA family hydrolase [Gammaproteobacteria bacterium]